MSWNAGLVFHICAGRSISKLTPSYCPGKYGKKDKFSLSLVKHHCFKVCKGIVIQHSSMYCCTKWRRVVASRLCSLSPGETDTGARWIGSWVDPRASLDAMGVRPRFLVRDVDIKCDVPQLMQVVVYCRHVSTSYSRANNHFVLYEWKNTRINFFSEMCVLFRVDWTQHRT